MKILGISAYYHDSAAAILNSGEIVAAAQEERFSRKKHDAGFPTKAVEYCLKESNLTIDELDAVVFYDKPLLKFERLLETYYAFAPKGLRSFLMSMPVWLKEKMFLKKLLRDELRKIQSYDSKNLKLLFPEHHLSHAASAFFPSAFEEAAILTMDGVGEWTTASVCHGKGNKISILKELHFPHSVGLLYSAFTYYLGFKVNSGEYKLMGLAPYGNESSAEVKKYIQIIKNSLTDIIEDGSLWLNQEYFDYATGLRMVHEKKWEKLFGFPVRKEESELKQCHCDLALAIQRVTEEIVLKMAAHAKELTGSENICLAGGVALNSVANGKLQQSGIFKNIFIQPAGGDAGGALGAALAAHYIYFQKERKTVSKMPDEMKGTYLGPGYSEADIRNTAKKFQAEFLYEDNFGMLTEKAAKMLAEGKVVGWFQGRMEFGPRALGNRSILADPQSEEMQKKLNLKIKYRESFRPFAPAVLAEEAENYFDIKSSSPYMLLVYPVKEKRRKKLPDNYSALPVTEKLYHLRSDIPAVTHVDFSARVQTVHKYTNEKFWTLLNAFKKKTGCPVLINSSFNVRGEPIVCTPEDAYRCFMRTEMDVLVMGNFIFEKQKQPEWKEKESWKEELVLD